MYSEIFYWLQIVAAIIIILFVVIQPSKGSDLGSMSGGTNATGNKGFIDPMTKATGVVLVLYMFFSFMVSWSSIHLDKTENEANVTTIIQEEKGDSK